MPQIIRTIHMVTLAHAGPAMSEALDDKIKKGAKIIDDTSAHAKKHRLNRQERRNIWVSGFISVCRNLTSGAICWQGIYDILTREGCGSQYYSTSRRASDRWGIQGRE